MAGQLQALFQKFDLMHCVVAFVKDEGNNLISSTTFYFSLSSFETLVSL
jgi:hypothetical protein